MGEIEPRSITIDRDDQKAVFRGYVAESWKGYLALGVPFMLFVFAVGTIVDGRTSPATALVLALIAVLGGIVIVAILIWGLSVTTRRQLPVGTQVELSVTEGTLDLDRANGVDRIRWRQLSNLKRVGGGVYFTVATSKARIGLPWRLFDEQFFALLRERIAHPVDDVADVADGSTDAASDALRSSIVVTAADQRAVLGALLRGVWKVFAFIGAIALLALVGLVAGIVGVLSERTFVFAGVIAVVAVLMAVLLALHFRRMVKRGLSVGTEQTVEVSPDALVLTGPGGQTRFLWHQITALRRTGTAVTVKATSSKTTMVFAGRIIDEEMYATVEQRIRAAQATPASPDNA